MLPPHFSRPSYTPVISDRENTLNHYIILRERIPEPHASIYPPILMLHSTLYYYSDLLTDIVPLHTRHERVVSGCTGKGEVPLQYPTTSAPDVGEGGNASSGHVWENHGNRRATT